MAFGNIIFAAICCLCSLIFGVIALWAFKRKDPMHFWSGTTVRPEEITDIPSYNRANGLMWTIYTICMIVTGILSLFSIITGVILLIILCVPGTVVLIVAYNRIYYKYKSTAVIYRTDESTAKTPKAVIIAIISITAIIVISLVPLFYYGEKDPDISILDNQIQIKAMYGLNIDFSEISKISLIEKSMSEIGTVKKTNGYDGIGGTLKGNFKADHLGEILLFVKSKSALTIEIERTNKEAVYISLRNSKNTEQLYQDLIKKYH
ncbi:hypothetical protein [Clostridium saccharoperbutylacetonicum]|uniref:hypothetical protein n=1 Tax=Clostridium saccharoperbutylacetonicum TaxID=36745 RepID=UPI000983F8A9|nr:hypothetical protein [Clostridium saccharoperbutylacetonicum]AQR95895.1 hypothetical protein CLSAP_32110 [Clostridium saccharoperbutylacetonicum]NSB31760.1 hypothetical protein [Clostridium saccharoperbutylacetonicum]